VTPALVTTMRGAPDADVLREAMRRWAFNPPRRDMPMPTEIDAALRWLARSSVPLASLQEASAASGGTWLPAQEKAGSEPAQVTGHLAGVEGAPSRIRTYAHGSGGRCSIP
jgi:hypothetical protein